MGLAWNAVFKVYVEGGVVKQAAVNGSPVLLADDKNTTAYPRISPLLVVGSSGNEGNMAPFSQGLTETPLVNLWAAGVDVACVRRQGTPQTDSGTSFSAGTVSPAVVEFRQELRLTQAIGCRAHSLSPRWPG